MNMLITWPLFNIVTKSGLLVLQTILLSYFLYYIGISVFGWVKRNGRSADSFPCVNRFAVLVAAHNEETVIGNIVRNLRAMNYPRNMYDVFVIADNCSDQTARIARENGAIVHERFNTVKRGKGYSLEWMFEKLFRMDKKYDAVCIFDADNLASPNFLMEMNKHLCMGHEVIQGYLDSKNPHDTWIASNNSIAFWIGNRMFQLPRYYLGLSCILGGTGFVVKTDVLKEIGWGATCLVEDLEFTLKLVLKGKKVHWAHDAIIFDEKPLGLPQSWRQRKRWMQGHFDCMKRYLPDLFTKAFKDMNYRAFDAALYMFQPLIVVINGLVMAFALPMMIFAGDPAFWVSFGLMYLGIGFLILEKKVSLKTLMYFATSPFYNLTWVPIIIQGFIDMNKKEWVHTLHTKVLDIDDVEALKKVG